MAPELIFTLVTWINQKEVMAPVVPDNPPQVHIIERPDFLLQLQYCLLDAGQSNTDWSYRKLWDATDVLMGLYCDDQIFIKADATNDYGDIEHYRTKLTLVHELVHWMQDYNGEAAKAECVKELERDAYIIGREWLVENGHDPWPNDLTIYFNSRCNPPGGGAIHGR